MIWSSIPLMTAIDLLIIAVTIYAIWRCRLIGHSERPSFCRAAGWSSSTRRLAKDFENLGETLATFVTLASIELALRRLAKA